MTRLSHSSSRRCARRSPIQRRLGPGIRGRSFCEQGPEHYSRGRTPAHRRAVARLCDQRHARQPGTDARRAEERRKAGPHDQGDRGRSWREENPDPIHPRWQPCLQRAGRLGLGRQAGARADGHSPRVPRRRNDEERKRRSARHVASAAHPLPRSLGRRHAPPMAATPPSSR